MTEFVVSGPHPIMYKKNKSVKRISKLETIDFWNTWPDLKSERGCYIFALRKKSTVPFYIGKATKNFGQEVFTSHKIEKFNDVLHSNTFGNPVFYFIIHPPQRGKTNGKAIDEIETYLIQSALIVNDELRNVQKATLPSWTIRNIITKSPGRPKKEELQFAKMMRLK
jgi:hypothetical protein